MQSKILILFIVVLSGYSPIALAEEINVTDADYIWNMSLENATNVSHLKGELGVMVVKYADVISYQPLENANEVNHLVGEPGVMVVKYADVISYQPLDNPTEVGKRELYINITNPQHGDIVLSSPVNVKGTAFSPNEIVEVTVNGVHATGTTSWNASIPLSFGINTIKVNVTTNTTYSAEKSIKVFYYYGGLFGDFNGNGVLDSGDVTILMRKIVGLE